MRETTLVGFRRAFGLAAVVGEGVGLNVARQLDPGVAEGFGRDCARVSLSLAPPAGSAAEE